MDVESDNSDLQTFDWTSNASQNEDRMCISPLCRSPSIPKFKSWDDRSSSSEGSDWGRAKLHRQKDQSGLSALDDLPALERLPFRRKITPIPLFEFSTDSDSYRAPEYADEGSDESGTVCAVDSPYVITSVFHDRSPETDNIRECADDCSDESTDDYVEDSPFIVTSILQNRYS